MPLAPPPAIARIAPQRVVLAAGSRLWRVHRKYRSVAEFKDVSSDPHFGGNRFDSTPENPYPFLYAAREQQTALIETLVRGVAFDDHGQRMISRAAVDGYRISAIEPAHDLTLISLLTTTDLATICQDEWLIQTPPSEYPQTRRWGQWLRAQAPWAHGMIWPSCRNLGRHCMILFGDRLAAPALHVVQETAIDLDDASGAAWLNRQLAPYRISVKPPSRHHADLVSK